MDRIERQQRLPSVGLLGLVSCEPRQSGVGLADGKGATRMASVMGNMGKGSLKRDIQLGGREHVKTST